MGSQGNLVIFIAATVVTVISLYVFAVGSFVILFSLLTVAGILIHG